uniref:Uncharacterized protein n=1 Tax=Rhizochromulina marina TaxID=1034831 RepID=A0A7S2WCS1_9STRA|mmetsp:Transcript_20635/g.60312  ORF Transcript_20635/g.60312 Transcript_20635/m.60312 type:complete len:265 (+) Transcript_20635:154-948(+)
MQPPFHGEGVKPIIITTLKEKKTGPMFKTSSSPEKMKFSHGSAQARAQELLQRRVYFSERDEVHQRRLKRLLQVPLSGIAQRTAMHLRAGPHPVDLAGRLPFQQKEMTSTRSATPSVQLPRSPSRMHFEQFREEQAAHPPIQVFAASKAYYSRRSQKHIHMLQLPLSSQEDASLSGWSKQSHGSSAPLSMMTAANRASASLEDIGPPANRTSLEETAEATGGASCASEGGGGGVRLEMPSTESQTGGIGGAPGSWEDLSLLSPQ